MFAKMFFCFIVVSAILFGGEKNLTGNLRNDLILSFGDSVIVSNSVVTEVREKKNPMLNGLFSLVIPGAGQINTEYYTEAAIFIGAEIAAIAATLYYNKKGDDKTVEFQNYADTHWSAERYAMWIMTHGVKDYGPTNQNINLADVRNNNFSQINEWERGLHSSGFSHTLPAYGEQQYFELIGKYAQFKYGWDTYPIENGVPISDGGSPYLYLPDQMKNYAAERGKANDFYYNAKFAARLILLNHILSMVDGFISAKMYNTSLSSSVGMNFQRIGNNETLMTRLNVQVGF